MKRQWSRSINSIDIYLSVSQNASLFLPGSRPDRRKERERKGYYHPVKFRNEMVLTSINESVTLITFE